MKLSPFLLMLLTYAAGFTALATLDGEQQRPVVSANTVKANYQRCIRVDNGPLRPPPQRFNHRGHVSEIA